MNDIFCENVDEVCGVGFCSNFFKLMNVMDEYDCKLVIRLLSFYVGIGVFVVFLIIVLFD